MTEREYCNGDQDVKCPFCGETGFDLIGLKSHIKKGECDACEALETITSPFDGIFGIPRAE